MPLKKSSKTAAPADSYSNTLFLKSRKDRFSADEDFCKPSLRVRTWHSSTTSMSTLICCSPTEHVKLRTWIREGSLRRSFWWAVCLLHSESTDNSSWETCNNHLERLLRWGRIFLCPVNYWQGIFERPRFTSNTSNALTVPPTGLQLLSAFFDMYLPAVTLGLYLSYH